MTWRMDRMKDMPGTMGKREILGECTKGTQPPFSKKRASIRPVG